jgi:hypothetical protein
MIAIRHSAKSPDADLSETPMGLLKSRLLEKLMLLSIALSRRIFRRNTSDLDETLTPEAKAKLLEKATQDCSTLELSHLTSEITRALFSPEAMLGHPFLIHFIRPASRMALKLGHKVNGIPILSSPNLRFAGRATMLDNQAVKLVEIPLGSVLLLRELGLAIVNLHFAIEYREEKKIQFFSRVCRFLSALLFKPAPLAFEMGQVAFAKVPMSYKVYATQASHVLGVFLILHELGHICLGHNLVDPISDKECRTQELAADVFAMDCQFAPKKGNPRYEPFRKMQMIYVCHMFSIFDVGLADLRIELDGYPSFASRREALLEHFLPGSDVVRSVKNFNAAIVALPPPDLHAVEL